MGMMHEVSAPRRTHRPPPAAPARSAPFFFPAARRALWLSKLRRRAIFHGAVPLGLSRSQGYFVGRKELVGWVQQYFQPSFTKVEDCASGVVYCQIIDSIYPGAVPMSRHAQHTSRSEGSTTRASARRGLVGTLRESHFDARGKHVQPEDDALRRYVESCESTMARFPRPSLRATRFHRERLLTRRVDPFPISALSRRRTRPRRSRRPVEDTSCRLPNRRR